MSEYEHTLRVLLVEDDYRNQDIADRMLKKLGCQVHRVQDGYQAIEAFKSHSFDMIFMDCRLPVMDGYEATKQIRNLEAENTRVPIIAYTADAVSFQKERCLQAGMDDCILKPVLYADFERMIAQHFEGRDRRDSEPNE